jgi:phospholipid/cholesterol/gamma-HCH transport system ATP-binding protein
VALLHRAFFCVNQGTGPRGSHWHLSDNLIEIDHVTFAYEAGGRTILNDVSLSFPRGKVTAILGAPAAARPRCCA